MTCISSTLRTLYQTRHDKYETLLASALTYYELILTGEGMESFKFDSGEAMSWAKYTNPADFLLKVITPTEALVDHYRNALNGTGIVRLNLRMR